ncbi:VOC family protein [Psychrobacter aestuarii]|uniref:VOC family protein n=1 Tax=Psychrobacter aestuarii TaxID=556327 RepID=A0ABP3FA06_9GAMM|nr:VOC family protein [Psychrobacter aestuarii]
MFTHVVVGTNDITAAKLFYDAVLGTLGIKAGVVKDNSDGRVIYMQDGQFFVVTRPIDGEAATFGNGMTIGFRAQSAAAVDDFYHTAMRLGAVSETVPNQRNNGMADIYVAHVRDLTGNKLCVACTL